MKTSIFTAKIGCCSMSLGPDRRKRYSDGFSIALKYTIRGATYYHRLNWRVTESDWERIVLTSTSRGRKSANQKSDANLRNVWQDSFDAYRIRLENLAKVAPLSLDAIRINLTGRSEQTNFLSVWQEVIDQKKANTAMSYQSALKSFVNATSFKPGDGFSVTKETIHKWVQRMTDEGKSKTTIGIYLRSCRVIVRECICRGYIQQADYPFSDRDADKVSIPRGRSRREESLSVEQMTELFNVFREMKYPEEWGKEYTKVVHESLGLFLFMYLGNGMNLADVARLTYNNHYFITKGQSLMFHRTKTKDRTDNESEVIVPVIRPLQYIMGIIAAKPEYGERVFPFILNDAVSEKDVAARIAQMNQNIRKRLRKLTKAMGWEVAPSPTWCRHSFATNMAHAGTPMQYISDAMGHAVGKSVTMSYINTYTHETQVEYNSRLLNLEPTKKADNLSALIAGLSAEEKAKLLEMLTNNGGEK